MKFIQSTLAAFIAIFLFSCSEEEVQLSKEDQLHGTWKMSALEYTGSSTTSGYGTETITNFTGEGYDMNLSMGFDKAKKTYNSTGSL